MDVTLSTELEDLIREKVASGDYRDQNEVVSRALRLLDKYERRMALEAAIDQGEADLREGRFVEFATDEEIRAFFAAL